MGPGTPATTKRGISGDDDEIMDDDDEDASEDDDDDGDDDDGDLAAELAAFRREEAEANRLAAAKSQNAVKGAAVRRQNEMWEKALQTRIVLQRALNASAKMPTPPYAVALCSADANVTRAMATCAAAARGALDALCSLQAALIDGNPAIAEAAAAGSNPAAGGEGEGATTPAGGGKKRKASSAMAAVSKFGLLAAPAPEVWKSVDSVYERYAAFRDVSIDRWHRKAQVQVGKMSGGGGGGGGGGEMRAFNQSVSSQVASAMRIPDRLIRKSQPPRTSRRGASASPPPRRKRLPPGIEPRTSTRTILRLGHTPRRAWRSSTMTPTFTSRCSRNFWNPRARARDSPPPPSPPSVAKSWTGARARGGS